MAAQPKVLLCDEITSALDAEAAWKVMQVLGLLRKQGVAIVLVSHDEELLAAHCAEIIQL